MTLEFIYRFLLLVWILFNVGIIWEPRAQPYGPHGNGLLLFLLFVLIGLNNFGPPIHR